MNRRLRDHLSAGFTLRLSHGQLYELAAVHRGQAEGFCGDLEARGLVRSTEDRPELTNAGLLVVRLLQEAGLLDYYQSGEERSHVKEAHRRGQHLRPAP